MVLKLNSYLMAAFCGIATLNGNIARRVTTSAFTHAPTKNLSSFTRSKNKSFTRIFSSSTTAQDETQQQNMVHNRIPLGTLTSLDSRAILDNLDLVLSHLTARRAPESTLDAAREIYQTNSKRVTLIQKRDKALQTRNEASATIGKLMQQKSKLSNPEDVEKLEAQVEEVKAQSNDAAMEASKVDEELAQLEADVAALLSSIPNLLDDDVTDGTDDKDNPILSSWGDIHTQPSNKQSWPESFEPKWHDDVATSLGGWYANQAVAISGARFVALGGQVARLERALTQFFLDLHSTHHDDTHYTEVSLPLIVSRSSLEGTSQLPKFEQDLFRISRSSHLCNGEDAFLIPTAEVPLTNLHRDSILEEKDLPISYVGLTPCFRAEAGSYGRDTRGLIRTHQFMKVELVKITSADSSREEHEKLTRHAELCLEKLNLPYRRVRLCSGDIGFSARLCYDLEVWLPGSKEYREISSCSNTGDFQARRMGLRYRPSSKEEESSDSNDKKNNKKKKGGKPKPVFCHTINGSGLAVGRALVAVLENYQMPDGSVVVPEALRPYMGGLEVLKPIES